MDIMPCRRTLLCGYSSTTHCSEPVSLLAAVSLIQSPYSCSVPHNLPWSSCLLKRLIHYSFSGSVPHTLPSSSCLLKRPLFFQSLCPSYLAFEQLPPQETHSLCGYQCQSPPPSTGSGQGLVREVIHCFLPEVGLLTVFDLHQHFLYEVNK